MKQLADEIARANAFVLLIGEKGLGRWQFDEYCEARDRRVPVVLVLLEGQPARGLPMLRQLHWIVTAEPASEHTVARVLASTESDSTQPQELWRHTAPYRGLAAMTESDVDFFFGRNTETVEVIKALAAAQRELPILLGNSGSASPPARRWAMRRSCAAFASTPAAATVQRQPPLVRPEAQARNRADKVAG